MALASYDAKIIHAATFREHVMNKYKYLALIGLATASLFATQAFAATCPAGQMGSPVCISTTGGDGANTSLQDILGPSTGTNSLFSSGPGTNVYTQQAQKSFWSVTGSSGSISTILLQLTSNANGFTFGIFDPNNASNMLPILTGGSTGAQATLTTYINGGYAVNYGPIDYFSTTNLFGFFLTTPGGVTFYSVPTLNSDGIAHMVAYQGDGTSVLAPIGQLSGGLWASNEYILAWEDALLGGSDLDYQDFIVMVESVRPVPEPADLGMFGLGLLLIGGFVAIRRRRQYNA